MFAFAALTLFILAALLYKRLTSKSAAPYPPGPKGLPLIGNVLDIPPEYQWIKFGEWKKLYGDVISVSAFGQRLVVLNTLEACIDLLDKRGAIYSERPILPMVGKLMGWAEQLVLLPLGENFRNQRRFLHRHLGSRNQLQKIEPWNALIESQAKDFLKRSLTDGASNIVPNLHKLNGSIVLKMGYGYDIKEGKDPLIALVNRALDGFQEASTPGNFLIDVIPWLEHVPKWFPGAGFKRKAEVWRGEFEDMTNIPYETAKKEASQGKGGENFVSMGVNGITSAAEEWDFKNAVASLYAGGADTLVSATMSFILAMTLNPEIQKKAQAEIDLVIGNDRLPVAEDYEQLPYVQAVMSEVYRFHPVAPMDIPHRVAQDDIYKGMLIPKDSTVIINAWQISRDPNLYRDPLAFNPERFLGDHPERNPRDVVFGFGRRVCLGINLAEVAFFTAVANILATYNITKVVENGVEITPEVAYTAGTTSHPKPFKFNMTPRSEKAVALINAL